MNRVVIESPFVSETAEGVEANAMYLRRCLRDSLMKGEAPFASHAIYTQEGVLDDGVPEERSLGIAAGIEWDSSSSFVAVYVDRGISSGMVVGIVAAANRDAYIDVRALDRLVTEEDLRAVYRPALQAVLSSGKLRAEAEWGIWVSGGGDPDGWYTFSNGQKSADEEKAKATARNLMISKAHARWSFEAIPYADLPIPYVDLLRSAQAAVVARRTPMTEKEVEDWIDRLVVAACHPDALGNVYDNAAVIVEPIAEGARDAIQILSHDRDEWKRRALKAESVDRGEEVRSAWTETDRLRAFIRSLEWSAREVSQWSGAAFCCPSCRGVMPCNGTNQALGHSGECLLVAALRSDHVKGIGGEGECR